MQRLAAKAFGQGNLSSNILTDIEMPSRVFDIVRHHDSTS